LLELSKHRQLSIIYTWIAQAMPSIEQNVQFAGLSLAYSRKRLCIQSPLKANWIPPFLYPTPQHTFQSSH